MLIQSSARSDYDVYIGQEWLHFKCTKLLETTHQVPFHMNTFHQFSRYILILISSTAQNISEGLNSRLHTCALVCTKDRRNILHILLWMFDVIAYQGYCVYLYLHFILSLDFYWNYLYHLPGCFISSLRFDVNCITTEKTHL